MPVLSLATARRWPVIPTLGIVRIWTWGSSFYLMTVRAKPIASDTGWPLWLAIGAVSSALLAAGFVSRAVGAAIARRREGGVIQPRGKKKAGGETASCCAEPARTIRTR